MNRVLLRYNSSAVDDDLQVRVDKRLEYILVPVDALGNVINIGIIVAFLMMVSLVALAAYCIPICFVECNCWRGGRGRSRRRKRRLLPQSNSV